MIKINSGIYKGKKIEVLNNSQVRPLPSRGRESLINRIQNNILDSEVLDCFAGSGIFGIECLSREAKHITFIESDKKVVNLLKKNLSSVGITENYKIIKNDIFKISPSFLKSFDIIFADPPFGKNYIEKFLKWVIDYNLLKPSSILIIKHESDLKIEELEGFTSPDTRFFSSVAITIYKKR